MSVMKKEELFTLEKYYKQLNKIYVLKLIVMTKNNYENKELVLIEGM